VTGDDRLEKQDNWIGYVYIRHEDASASFPLQGTYEIVRVGSSSQLNDEGMVDLIIHAPGVADMNKATAFGATSGKTAYLYKATPLMPMWPSFSNSIALHDSSFRIVLAPEKSVAKPLHATGTGVGGHGQDIWGHNTPKLIANIHYGPYGTKLASDALTFHPNMVCDGDILQRLDGFATADGAAGRPYPSLAAADGKSICDCKKTTMEVEPYEVEFTITCPGWLGYLINNDVTVDASGDGDFVHPQDSTNINVLAHHRRLSPERTLEQLVAVGDTVTVTASSANTNKQFKVSSFAHDNMWGDGNKGSAIWSAKSGYLGGEHAEGFGGNVALSESLTTRLTETLCLS
jgi:hypothetical protein